jgi:UDP-N-acetyl-D-galactosamine dehydrogenase
MRLAVVGLGYVGLPLAVEFAKYRPVVGFDISERRVSELRGGHDATRELSEEELLVAEHLRFTMKVSDLIDCNVFIVTVPTPVDDHKQPDFGALIGASRTVGGVLKAGDIVIYESTVYPGATEEVCVPVLEQVSGLRFNVDFFAGYSPERVNPGDKQRRVANIKKITSGSTPEIADFVDELYRQIVIAGTHKAPSIKVAEAAKVIENTQRDINIAIVNEFTMIFNRLGIDTEAVLSAAGTKWNFLPFRPGLVGGHCTGVDPYYLSQKAIAVGYHPEIILAARRLNDSMGNYVASQVIKAMVKARIHVVGARLLVMGLAFKENCPDLRNTRIVDFVRELTEYSVRVDVCDPWVVPEQAEREYGLTLVATPEPGAYDAIIVAVAHDEFRAMGASRIRAFGKSSHVLYDLKYILPPADSDLRL